MYQCGFAALTLGAVEYALALDSHYDVVRKHWAWWTLTPWIVGILCLALYFRFAKGLQGSTLVEWLFRGKRG